MAKREGYAPSILTKDSTTLINKYEVLLLEKGGERMSPKRMTLMFQMLEELLPNLGVFTKVVSSIRDELFDAIYSERYTSEAADSGSYVQRVPYFKLVQDIFAERNERADDLEEQLHVVKEKLFLKHKSYEEAQDLITNLQKDVSDLKKIISNLESDLVGSQTEVSRLNESLESERQSAHMTQHSLNCDITELKADLKDARNEIAFLNKYKKGYDDLEAAFTIEISVDEFSRRKAPVIATKRAHLINNIQAALKIENQILKVQNAIIEEYDNFLEEHKTELSSKPAYEDPRDIKFIRQEPEIERADQELFVFEERFKKTVDDMDSELDLIRQHRTMLEEQLQKLEESNPSVPIKKKTLKEVSQEKVEEVDNEQKDLIKGILNSVTRPDTQGSILTTGLDDQEEADDTEDPFIPHERVFSKYAAMMYTSSNNGKNWHEIPDAKYCPSCGEKTMICPHKVGGKNRLLKVPHGCTHIKITRPKVKINRELVQEVLKASADSDTDPSVEKGVKPDTRSGKKFRSLSSMLGKVGASSRAEILSGMSTPTTDAHLAHPLTKLWLDYKERTQLQRVIPRPLKISRALSMVEQYYAFIIWQDETGQEDDEGFFSLLDNLYYFMSERYMKEEITYLTIHDLFTAIVESSASSKMIHVFGHILVGNLDGAVFRYILLVCDFIDLVDWRDVEDFRVFAGVVYPLLGDDDLETLQMGYTSYSENKISKRRVLEFLTYLILKYREPRFQDLEAKLVQLNTQEIGQFTYAEYSEGLEQVLPIHNDILRKRLFWESEAHLRMENMEKVVTVARLAQITGYLGLVQLSQIIRQTVASKVAEAREKDTERQSLPNPTQHGADTILTYSKVRGLAVNINRRKNNRNKRLKEEAELYA